MIVSKFLDSLPLDDCNITFLHNAEHNRKPELWLCLGRLLCQRGLHDKAQQAFTRGVEVSVSDTPSFVFCLVELAGIWLTNLAGTDNVFRHRECETQLRSLSTQLSGCLEMPSDASLYAGLTIDMIARALKKPK